MISARDLKHGYIYMMTTGEKARCNVCSQGAEIWFTNKQGKCVGGSPDKLASEKDESFKHYDIK